MQKLITYGPSITVLLTAAVVLLAGPSAIHRLSHAHTMASVIQASDRLDRDNVLEQINQAYRDIATFVEPSVVHISASRQGVGQMAGISSRMSTGSGWVYDEHGHIITNYHVVEQTDRIDVQLYNGEIRSATLVGADPTTDIAVLKIPPSRLHPAMRVDPGREIKRGDLVFAFGSPFDFRFSMSSGIVSGMGRSVGLIRDPLGIGAGYENFIQVDAAINPGNSGGPLTDFRGHVIGMNTAIATAARSDRSEEGQFSGIGLAIPIDMIESAVQQLIQTGEVQKGYLGIAVIDRSRRVSEEFAVMRYHGAGIVVAAADEVDPALAENLRIGDVLTQINSQSIHSRDDLPRIVRNLDFNKPVELTVWRFDHERNRGRFHQITLDARLVVAELLNYEFVHFEEAVATRLSHIGYHKSGVVVGPVQPHTPAREAGVRRGDVITHVNGKPVAQAAQLRSIISSMFPGDEAQLRVWRFDEADNYAATLDIAVPLARLDMYQAFGIQQPGHMLETLERLGLARMETLTRSRAEELDIAYRPGILVTEVLPDSAIARLMQTGSIIVTVRDVQVTNVEELLDRLGESNLRAGVRISVINPDGSVSVVTLRDE